MNLNKYFLYIFVAFFCNSTDNTATFFPSEKLPIIYSHDYDISFFGIEKLQPFDTHKYSTVFNALSEEFGFTLQNCYQPTRAVSNKDLSLIHHKKYLDALDSWWNSYTTTWITEMLLLLFVPHFLLRNKLLYPMRLGTQGTIEGIEIAFNHGWAINLSGGYHHAKPKRGEGFCFYADIPLAILKMRENEEHKNKKVLIVDLDAHHGNGHAECCKNDPLTFIFDIYNKDVYPVANEGLLYGDTSTTQYVTYDHPIARGTSDEEYLSIVRYDLAKAVAQTKPDLIIYNAGTDIYKKDPLGQLKVSRAAIIERDRLVFELAEKKSIPILMTLSGGYTKESAAIIAESITKNCGKKIQHYMHNLD